jgi:hypothetical protein
MFSTSELHGAVAAPAGAAALAAGGIQSVESDKSFALPTVAHVSRLKRQLIVTDIKEQRFVCSQPLTQHANSTCIKATLMESMG